MLGFCISGSNLTGEYITFPGTFCRDGRGGNFFDLLYMDVYSIEDSRSYAIAANEVVYSTTIAYPTPTTSATPTNTATPTSTPILIVTPPSDDGLLNGTPSSSFKFVPSLLVLFVITVFALVILN